MSEPQYVRHISGQGELWLVQDWPDYLANPNLDWCVHRGGQGRLYLPKSEYVLCEPPERWVDITRRVTIDDEGDILDGEKRITKVATGYRVREIPIGMGNALDGIPWAFIIEKKVQP